MELGNYLFGNSRGRYEIERRQAYSTEFNKLRYAMQKKNRWKDDEENAFENDVFAFFPYYWGDCDCGRDDREREWTKTHKHTSDCFHILYQKEEKRIEDKAFSDIRMIAWSKKHGCVEAPAGMAVYCDCGHDEEWNAFIEVHGHTDTCIVVRPNFHHKRSGLKIRRLYT